MVSMMDVKAALNPAKAFKVYLYHKDRRVTQHIVLPKDGQFSIKGNGYIVNPERVFFEKKIPCSMYSAAVAEPINPLDMNEKSKLSSQDFYNAIEARVVQDIIRAGTRNENMLLMMAVLAAIGAIGAVVYAIYYLGGMIDAQNLQIAELLKMIIELKGSSNPDLPVIIR